MDLTVRKKAAVQKGENMQSRKSVEPTLPNPAFSSWYMSSLPIVGRQYPGYGCQAGDRAGQEEEGIRKSRKRKQSPSARQTGEKLIKLESGKKENQNTLNNEKSEKFWSLAAF